MSKFNERNGARNQVVVEICPHNPLFTKFKVYPHDLVSMAHKRSDAKPKKEIAEKDVSDIKSMLLRWLQRLGNYIGEVEIPNTHFAINLRYPSTVPSPAVPLNITLISDKQDPTRLIAVANIVLNDIQRQMLMELDEVKTKFIDELKYNLLFRCGYAFLNDPTTQALTAIQLSEEVFVSSDNDKNMLFESFRRMYAAYLFVSWKLAEIAGSQSTPPER